MNPERYSSEIARNEAERMENKTPFRGVPNYPEAEAEVNRENEDFAKEVEDARDGVTAELLRSIDLSTQEGTERLRQIIDPKNRPELLSLFDNHGSLLFPKNNIEGSTEYFIEATLDCLSSVDRAYGGEKMNKEGIDTKKIQNWGHSLVKIGNFIQPLIDIGNQSGYTFGYRELAEEIEKPEYASNNNKFLLTLGVIADTTGEAFNHGLTGFVLIRSDRAMREGKISEAEFQNRLDSLHITEALGLGKQVLQSVGRLFRKYLSNIIQEAQYSIPSNQKVSSKELADVAISLDKIMDQFDSGSVDMEALAYCTEHFEEGDDPNVIKMKEVIEKEVQDFIRKFERFQIILDEYDKNMSYATPKVPK